ncbi:LuxR C-terminal-related transcriptional regulator [Paenibacillus filicis]|uniref:LuxR C-terminal-related transcriptional regulator n=1 Tax=Paenibacillus gyeongsangnamensis TaxID=3388067 RepID=A0ABT4QFH8_9BACL|nr:LuxR C-terminal-related transcriptional regulator [Paenibacillus filicis]MCZ8515634.1 LuxR C-terminal-related transcriptional regulator [Paenibacillus filicis]
MKFPEGPGKGAGKDPGQVVKVAAGLSNKEIAGRLTVTSETVKVHGRNIFTKMNVNLRVTAVIEAKKRNLLP